MAEHRRLGRDAAAILAVGAVAVWLALMVIAPLGAALLRSTAVWERYDSAVAAEIVRLELERRRLHHDWDTTTRPDRRFDLDADIRLTDARIRELEPRVSLPELRHDLANYATLRGTPGAVLAASALRAAAIALAALLAALAIVPALADLSAARRRLVLVVLLAPLALPAALRAHAWSEIAQRLSLAGSEIALALAETSALAALALGPLLLAHRRLDPIELAAARALAPSSRVLRAVVLPRLAPTLIVLSGALFAAALGAFTLPTVADPADAEAWFAPLVRRRVVAGADLAVAAAWSVAAAALCLGATAALAAALARRPMPPPLDAIAPPRLDRPGRARLVPLALAVAISTLVLAVAARTALDGTPAMLVAWWTEVGPRGFAPADPARRLAAVLGEQAGAALLAALALPTAWVLHAVFERLPRPFARLGLAVASAPLVLPTPVLAVAARTFWPELGLTDPEILDFVVRLAAVSAGVLALLAIAPSPPSGSVEAAVGLGASPFDVARRVTLPRLAPMMPLAAVAAVVLALARADVAAPLGATRSPLLAPAAANTVDAAGLLALVVALLLARLAANALETATRAPDARPQPSSPATASPV